MEYTELRRTSLLRRGHGALRACGAKHAPHAEEAGKAEDAANILYVFFYHEIIKGLREGGAAKGKAACVCTSV